MTPLDQDSETLTFSRSPTLGKQVRQLAEQYTQEQKKHVEWIGELGVRVTTLTDAYDSLLENVNRMIDASNSVTRELNELFR